MPASHRRTHSAPPHAYRLSITAALSQCAPLSVPGPGAQIDSAGPANRAAPPPADDGGTDSDDDSIFSEAEGPCSSAAHALIRELELSLAALANANADLRFRVSLLRALVRRLARDVRTLVDEKRASASVTHSTPTEMPHARSPETHSSAGSRDLVHLAAALHASGFSDSHEGEDDPMAPHSPHVSAHSRSSSELHPAAESRSFSSFAPPTPTSAKYVPLGMSPPHILDASSMSGHSSAHSSHIALAPPPPRSQMKTPRQSMLAPAAPELKPSSREHKRSSRATVLSFLPSRNSSVRAATVQHLLCLRRHTTLTSSLAEPALET
jgi:hypothetical protein